MPTVHDFEVYRAAVATLNGGYQSLWMIVGLFIGLMVIVRPYICRQYIFYAVCGFGVFLRVSEAMQRPLWYDETFTAAIVRAPDFWGAVMGDVHPPLHYLIVKATATLFGASEFALRLPALVAGIVLIYAMYRLAFAYTRDERVAQTAAGLVALLAAPIYYSAEARYPALLALAVVGAMIGLAERRRWLVIVGAVAAAYLHATGAIYMVVFALAAWLIGWRYVSIGIMCASVFWMPAMAHQARDVSDGFWVLTQSPLMHVADMTLFSMEGTQEVAAALFAQSVIAGWTLVGVYMSRDWIQKRGGMWLVVAIGVPVTLGIISSLWHPVAISRVMLAPALLLLIAWAYAWPRLHWVWRGLLATAVILSWTGLFFRDDHERLNMERIFAACEGADVIYASSTNVAIQAMYYAPAPVRVWRHGNNLHQELPDQTRAAMGMLVVDGADGLPAGEICLIAQVSYHTTEFEQDEINHIRNGHRLTQDETLYADDFYAYQLMRWQAE